MMVILEQYLIDLIFKRMFNALVNGDINTIIVKIYQDLKKLY